MNSSSRPGLPSLKMMTACSGANGVGELTRSRSSKLDKGRSPAGRSGAKSPGSQPESELETGVGGITLSLVGTLAFDRTLPE